MRVEKGKVACRKCKHIQHNTAPADYAGSPWCMHPVCFQENAERYMNTLTGEIYYSDKRIIANTDLNANLDCKYFEVKDA